MIAVAEHPVLFSTPMSAAIRLNLKTQTRRLVNPAPSWTSAKELCATTSDGFQTVGHSGRWDDPSDAGGCARRCPYGVPGDLLWVRETWALPEHWDHNTKSGSDIPFMADSYTGPVYWRADGEAQPGRGRWRSPYHLPRVLVRTLLRVTAVLVERLQAITLNDCMAEGMRPEERDRALATFTGNDYARGWFRALWDSINGGRAAWASNPWVFAVSFQRVTR